MQRSHLPVPVGADFSSWKDKGSGLRAVRLGGSPGIQLNRTDTSTTETGFRIQQATDSGFTANVVTTTVPANAVLFRTTNLPRRANYYFRVQSFHGAGASAWTNAAPFPVNTG